MSDAYSEIAAEQIDAISDDALYGAVIDLCEAILATPGALRVWAGTVRAEQGMRFRNPVPGYPPYKVFWSQTPDGPRIEAVFPYEGQR